MKKTVINRAVIYVLGLLILAMGLTLNTKAELGVSPIISVSYCVSDITQKNFGNMTLILYCSFVVVEIILHSINYRGKQLRTILVKDILQVPLSLIFTRFLNIFSFVIPKVDAMTDSIGAQWVIRCVMLVLAFTLTGIGAAMSLNMRLVPNPGDGIVQAISDCIHKSVGFTKNCFDIFNVIVAIAIGLIWTGHLHGVGVGTIVTVIGIGRVIAVFNHFFKEKLVKCAGII